MKYGILTIMISLVVSSTLIATEWEPVQGNIMTKWAKDVRPDNVWPEYPRPQMKRKEWKNLNGLWDYAIKPVDEDYKPASADSIKKWADGRILVPFCVESALSGVKKKLSAEERLWYRRSFTIPKAWKGQRILLHFGAVDWDSTIFVNNKEIGNHKGGFDPFYFDITDALKQEDNELVVSVWDPTDNGKQPRGKQVTKPKKIWYTAVSGIWQTVWLEPVLKASIAKLKILPDIDNKTVSVTVLSRNTGNKHSVTITAKSKKKTIAKANGKPGQPVKLKINKPKLWSPDSPFLYDLNIILKHGEKVIDKVDSYFAMRKISLDKNEAGVPRIMLNNKFVFHYGPLDQGWWPDGLYTPPTEEAMIYDLKVLKKLGMNMLRKHVKVEPERLYYHCDKLGLLVWQDMPSCRKRSKKGKSQNNIDINYKGQFHTELQRMIDNLHNYPSIVIWVPFNEGWGQHDTEKISGWLMKYDPSRLVNEASGWHDKGSGHIKDIHCYPGPCMAKLEKNRAVVAGEFGGLGLPVKDHLWWNKRNWGYQNFKNKEDLQQKYDKLIQRLRKYISKGLSAGVYTQTTDVEGEVNGLMTYDRKVIKLDVEHTMALHQELYKPVEILKTTVLVPTSEEEGQEWKYTTTKPGKGWEAEGFNDSTWESGKGMFGTKRTPNTRIGTKWSTSDIWLKKKFVLKEIPEKFSVCIYHDEDAEVYINGILVGKFQGYVVVHEDYIIDKKGTDIFKKGENVMAVHCHQTSGDQAIDVGILGIKK